MGKKLTNNTVMVSDARFNIHEASRLATERSVSNKRLMSTGLALLLGSFLVFSSLFYIPAYKSKPTMVKISTPNGVTSNGEKEAKPDMTPGLTPFMEHLLLNRGYMRAGQTVSTSYVLPAGTRLKLVVTKCAGPAVVEVYSCGGTVVQAIEIGTRLEGKLDFIVQSKGFYHFTEEVIELSTSSPEYNVEWKRL